jgi:hypothetical protein
LPDIPKEAIAAAADAVMKGLGLKSGHSRAWAEKIVSDALETAAPVLAEAVAQKILAHADRQFPKTDPAKVPGQPDRWRTWHRHFRIAAQVAAFAFATEEDKKRMAAEAITRGDYVACIEGVPIPPEGGTFPIDGTGIVRASGDPIGGTVTFTPIPEPINETGGTGNGTDL